MAEAPTQIKDAATPQTPTEQAIPKSRERIPLKFGAASRRALKGKVTSFKALIGQQAEQIQEQHAKIAEQQQVQAQTDVEKAEAEKLARIDSLTGLPNRLAFDERYAQEVARNRRTGRISTIIVLDANKLKLINDTMGHSAGDEYIRNIGRALSNGIRRETDFVARTGGDEFIAILGETDLSGAEKAWIETFDPSFKKSVISISGGAAEIDVNNPEESIKAADRAMYGAKNDQERNGENLLYSYVPAKN